MDRNIIDLWDFLICFLYLKRKKAGIADDFQLTEISDNELQEEIRKIKHEMPDVGEKMVSGILFAKDIHVQRRRNEKLFMQLTQLILPFDDIKKFVNVFTPFMDQCRCGILVGVHASWL